MSDKVVLKIGGNEFRDWTSIFIEKSLYQMVGSFSLTTANILPGDVNKEWGISLEDECQVSINDQVIITGYIDDIPIEYSAESHNIQLNGRDKTCDLVDCSFVIEGEDQINEWKDQKIIRIIEDLANAFGIAVSVSKIVEERLNEKIPYEGTFKANEGDTVFDLIFKLCRMKAVLPISYGDGRLHLVEGGFGDLDAWDDLELGRNIKSGMLTQFNRDRFSRYILKGQSEKTVNNTEVEASQIIAEYEDKVIPRYRPFVVLSEYKTTEGWAKERIKWEATNRAGASRSVEYEVQGWTQSNGIVWPLNGLVRVKDNFLFNKDVTLLIAEINFTLDEELGTITRLGLVHPDTFKLPPNEQPIIDISTPYDWMNKL